MSFIPKFGAAVALACMAAPVFAEDVTIATAAGEVTLAANPTKIAVLDIAAVDTLDALGVEVAAIPTPVYVDYLDDVAATTASAGSLFEPDFEGLVKLNPDVIVAGGRSSSQIEPLSEVTTTIDMTVWGDDHIAQVLSRLNALGTLAGKEAEAAALEAAFTAKLADVQAAVAGQGNGLVIMTNGPKVSAYGAGSRFGWLHVATGLPEAVEGVDAQTHGEAISFEFIAEANPDWLIVVDRASAIGQEGDAASATLNNPLVAGTTAWVKGQVIYLDSASVYIAGGGYQAMMRTMDDLIASFSGNV